MKLPDREESQCRRVAAQAGHLRHDSIFDTETVSYAI